MPLTSLSSIKHQSVEMLNGVCVVCVCSITRWSSFSRVLKATIIITAFADIVSPCPCLLICQSNLNACPAHTEARGLKRSVFLFISKDPLLIKNNINNTFESRNSHQHNGIISAGFKDLISLLSVISCSPWMFTVL